MGRLEGLRKGRVEIIYKFCLDRGCLARQRSMLLYRPRNGRFPGFAYELFCRVHNGSSATKSHRRPVRGSFQLRKSSIVSLAFSIGFSGRRRPRQRCRSQIAVSTAQQCPVESPLHNNAGSTFRLSRGFLASLRLAGMAASWAAIPQYPKEKRILEGDPPPPWNL